MFCAPKTECAALFGLIGFWNGESVPHCWILHREKKEKKVVVTQFISEERKVGIWKSRFLFLLRVERINEKAAQILLSKSWPSYKL